MWEDEKSLDGSGGAATLCEHNGLWTLVRVYDQVKRQAASKQKVKT